MAASQCNWLKPSLDCGVCPCAFVGVASLFAGCMDLLDMLAHRGMGVFPGFDANPPAQLWIVARCLESVTLLVAVLFVNRRRTRIGVVFVVYTAAGACGSFHLRLHGHC